MALSIDHSQMKLGKQVACKDKRTLKMSRYLATAPLPPAERDWRLGQQSWGMMCNDSLGCCVIAGMGHGDQVWTANLGKEYNAPDQYILDYYRTWGGWDPANSFATDNGMNELSALNLWRKWGFGKRAKGQGRTQLIGYADTNPLDVLHVKQGINLFGFAYIGLALPISAQHQAVWDAIDPEDPRAQPGSWGGHCVVVPAYWSDAFACITWGQNKTMTQAFWNAYVDEVHFLLSPDWIAANGVAASGFGLDDLLADLDEVIA